ncbi:hypothetical protein Z517_07219 [Fonsecaea pedrosoi CBS 271.37]|uniref:Unplaced genomic scaffold supercont1.4, whole genome shotgun sequence n=1 Tax=Fonsecaea pedrosoi CBS 271.37 TaxID=1442368 RepID=A0A0D2GII5_9EURO|nr:uncharacterized protein Z517_07219 [Fonsecaea pedrosoi CBS 271.37]KIW80603.1 hypothetical protein Z517_07219 [Fonsecaea pedrosoi CBS 271.37]
MVPPLITLEEHFFSKAVLTDFAGNYAEQLKHVPHLKEKLADLGELRLSSMDAGQVSLQIVSHAPGGMSASRCKAANDQLAESVKKHPNRFAGFAVLPISEPVACATELTRCVKELDFVGALIDNHTTDGTYFDGEAYLPMFQAAQDLDVPIYLHPTWATQEVTSLLYTGDNIPSEATTSLSSSAFGWHSDVAVHVLRLFASGLFDRLPKLKMIIGHMGEMLPFMLERVMQLSPRWGPHQRSFKTVWDENIWITTSGNWSVNPMACILRNTQPDRVLYSVDYPFATNENGLQFMRELEASGLVSSEQLEMIAHGNAEALLRVKHKKRWD